MPQETWDQQQQDALLRKTEHDEARSNQAILKSKVDALKAELDQQMALFLATDSELRLTRAELGTRVEELVQQAKALAEEQAVSGAFERGESRLNGVAIGLRDVAKESLGDLDGVFRKLGACPFPSLFLVSGRLT